MIENTVDLIERIVQKSQRYGLCWACKKRETCLKDDDKEFVDGCADFEDDEFIKPYQIY